jgi:hypothetical protein
MSLSEDTFFAGRTWEPSYNKRVHSSYAPVIPKGIFFLDQYVHETDQSIRGLISDYPDPFIPHEDNNKDEAIKQPEKQVPVNENSVAPKVPPKPAFDPSVIQYRGMISNPENKIRVAIVNIGGGEHLVKLNEIVSNCKIRGIEKDRLVVVYKGRSYTIERSK